MACKANEEVGHAKGTEILILAARLTIEDATKYSRLQKSRRVRVVQSKGKCQGETRAAVRDQASLSSG